MNIQMKTRTKASEKVFMVSADGVRMANERRRHKMEETFKNSGTDLYSPVQTKRKTTTHPHTHTVKKKDRRE